MEGFQEDRAIGLLEQAVAEEESGLCGIGDGGLFEQDMLACFKRFQRPFVV